MEQETPAWQRIQLVVRESGMTVNAFAYHIGLKRAENLYQIKKGNHGISRELATIINNHYPQFSIGWLLSGDGFCGVGADPEELILRNEVFKLISVYESLPDFDKFPLKVLKKVYLSETIVRDSQFALINFDQAIAPKIPLGAMMLVKPHKGVIVYGKIYIIETEHFTVIRILRTAHKPDHIRLTSPQSKRFDDIVIEEKEIRKLYSIDYILAEVV
ncbi:MAG: hypothetical protein LIO79_08140 [Rikenellaceae bacterium]|nr:hypothetical protein [Rikenellaceae bacterium]